MDDDNEFPNCETSFRTELNDLTNKLSTIKCKQKQTRNIGTQTSPIKFNVNSINNNNNNNNNNKYNKYSPKLSFELMENGSILSVKKISKENSRQYYTNNNIKNNKMKNRLNNTEPLFKKTFNKSKIEYKNSQYWKNKLLNKTLGTSFKLNDNNTNNSKFEIDSDTDSSRFSTFAKMLQN